MRGEATVRKWDWVRFATLHLYSGPGVKSDDRAPGSRIGRNTGAGYADVKERLKTCFVSRLDCSRGEPAWSN
jgi:hypothetical protein